VKEAKKMGKDKVVDEVAVATNAETWKTKYAADKMSACSWLLYGPKRPKTGLTGAAQQDAILKAAGTSWTQVASEMGFTSAADLWQNVPTTMG
jgi:hypothetical protein